MIEINILLNIEITVIYVYRFHLAMLVEWDKHGSENRSKILTQYFILL